MKINIELEIDWIDEEMRPDDMIKEAVVQRVSEKLEGHIKSVAEQEILGKVEGLVDDSVTKLFNDMSNQEIAITDEWGDVKKTYSSAREMVKKKFDSFLTERVDDRGKSHNGYGSSSTRIDYMINNQLKNFADKFTSEVVEKVKETTKTMLDEKLKQKIGGEITNLLKLDKLIEEKKR